jgi:ABC-type branched-subunit amino acid transport system substrate-binding protein
MKKIGILLLVLSQFSYAQLGDQSYLKEYKTAVQFFADAKYEQASVKFLNLMDAKYQNPMVPYVYFYQALSLKNRNRNYQARNTFNQLFERFPEWEKTSEAKLIFAELNFKEQYYFEALKSLDAVIEKKLQENKNSLFKTYIPQIQKLSLLKELYAKYPQNKFLATHIVSVIQSNRYPTKEDLQLSDQLTNRFGLNNTAKSTKSTKAEIKKKQIKVALLLPYSLEKNLNKTLENQYIYDFTAGFEIAVNELKLNQLEINKLVFDINNDNTSINRLLSNPDLEHLDAVVGPLYAQPNALIKSKLEQKGILQIHPFSTNKKVTENTNNIFLAQTSIDTQMEQCLQFIQAKSVSKNVLIFHNHSKKDSSLADAYKKIAQQKGFVLGKSQIFNPKSFNLEKEKGNVFFIGSEKSCEQFLFLCKQKNIKLPILLYVTEGNGSVLKEIENEHEVFWVNPEYVDQELSNVREFQKAFLEKMSSLPSYYAYLGHDIAQLLAYTLKDGKNLVSINSARNHREANFLLNGFSYSVKEKDNQNFKIYSLRMGIITDAR